MVFDDRRRLIRTTGDREMFVENCRVVARGTRLSRTLLATAGDRLSLERFLWTGAPDLGAFEVEMLNLVEVDAEGRCIAAINFDPDDRRAASLELLERLHRSCAAPWLAKLVDVGRAFIDRDLERLRAALPDDFVFHDHRRAGAGRLEGAEAYVAWMATLFESSPDAIIEPIYYLALEPHAGLAVAHSFGALAEGGAFENVFVQVMHEGCAELFEVEDLDRAWACFEELRLDATRIPANAASRASGRRHELWQARDWAALRTLASPDFTFEDRSKIARVSGDVETWIENNRFVHGGLEERELIGTAGDRIALERVLWRGGTEDSPVEREHLRLTEVDAEGRIRASIRFDPDDRAAAFAEAQARFVAGEAAAVGGQAPCLALALAVARHDWETARGCLGPDAAFHDHRPLSLGDLSGYQWVEALRVQVELAPDVQAEVLRILAWNRHGRVEVVRRFGTLRDGGPFENVFVVIELTEGDHVPHYEVFDVADAGRALARFDELCADRP
jgi:hypothetical protein